MSSHRSTVGRGFLFATLMLALVPFPSLAEDDPDTHKLDQFTITLPAGWFVHDQNIVMHQKGPNGVIIFSPVDLAKIAQIAPGQDAKETQQTFIDISSGKIPSFFVDRQPSEKGCTCAEGFTKKARKKLLGLFADDARGPTGKAVVRAPEVEDVMVGGCKGLRIRLGSTGPGAGGWEYLVHAVSDGTTTYDFSLRAQKEFFEGGLPPFEKTIPTVVLNAGRRP